MSRTVIEKRAAFRALHAKGCFVIPNPWDVGSARMLQHLGFPALASTSAGFAWTKGHADNHVTRDDVLHHLAQLSNGVDVPINADFENGFATSPEDVSTNVRLAIETGVAGLSIEDAEGGVLYERGHAVERIRAARKAIDHASEDVILVARTERLLYEPTAVTAAIDTLVALAEAGADCLFAPGVTRPEDIAAMVRAVAPKPLNVVMFRPGLGVAALTDLGVRRISVGGAIARVAWAAAIATAEEILGGSFEGLGKGQTSKQLNEMFA